MFKLDKLKDAVNQDYHTRFPTKEELELENYRPRHIKRKPNIWTAYDTKRKLFVYLVALLSAHDPTEWVVPSRDPQHKKGITDEYHRFSPYTDLDKAIDYALEIYGYAHIADAYRIAWGKDNPYKSPLAVYES